MAEGKKRKKPVTQSKRSGTTAVKKATTNQPLTARRLKRSSYKAFRLSKRIAHPVVLPSAWKISKQTTQLLRANWLLILKIVAIYGVCNILLVRGLNGGLDVTSLKDNLNQLSSGGLSHLASAFSIFALLVSSSNSASSDVAGAYQTFLILITSLALVWTFRQLRLGKQVRARDGFYAGTYPLIPIILILLVIGLQLIPMLIGGWLFTTVVQNGIAVSAPEQILWAILFFMLAVLSLYMLCSSLFALYIATLPGMTPMKALRSARELVRYRRSSVVRKLLFLPLLLLIVGCVIMLPCIWLVPVLAQWMFFALSMLALALIHAYMYTLYRELLHE